MFIRYFFCFIIYSFLGYLCEVTYVSFGKRQLTNRGYLYGPICPIYGYGAVIILFCLTPIYNLEMWYLIFILGVIITSLLEYLTSYIMEALFHMRWWDYSNKRFNINGRICLKNSILFGLLVMVVFYVTQPIINQILDLIKLPSIWYILFVVLMISYLIDTVFSTLKHINISKVLLKAVEIIDEIETELEDAVDQVKEYFNNKRLSKKIGSLNRRYSTVMIRGNDKKKRLSLKEMINRFKGDD